MLLQRAIFFALCFTTSIATLLPCGTHHSLPSLATRSNKGLVCSPSFQCSQICDDPIWRDAYASTLIEGRLDSISMDSNIHTWAPPDGVNGTAHTTLSSTMEQLQYVNNDYGQLNVTFNFSYKAVNSSWWFTRVSDVWESCPGNLIANDQRDYSCLNAGWDGGSLLCSDTERGTHCPQCTLPASCHTTPLSSSCQFPANCPCVCFSGDNCLSNMINDGKCDPECNYKQYNWDGQDCCHSGGSINGSICWNPISPYRGWTGLTEMKNQFNDVPIDHFNHYVVRLHRSFPFRGMATWPWASEAFAANGGIIINPNVGWGNATGFLTKSTVTHELGHMFGLYHTYRGVSEVGGCSDPCYEVQPTNPLDLSSNYTGDLCSDTRPTVSNFECSDPAGTTCSGAAWVNTPFRNFMSLGDQCRTEFTFQQRGRMRCYMDCSMQRWRSTKEQRMRPNTIVRPPTASPQANGGILVSWFAPLGFDDASNYSIEREPPFVSYQYAPVAPVELSFIDFDFVNDTSADYNGFAVVRYRVKKATATYWSAWSADTSRISSGPYSSPAYAPRTPKSAASQQTSLTWLVLCTYSLIFLCCYYNKIVN